MKCLSIRLVCALGVVAVFAMTPISAGGQTASRHHAVGIPAEVSDGNADQKHKGIWEPMNYPDDVLLEDVFFANDQVGWIAGKGTGGFILHTTDGGQQWEVQLGDPHSNNAEVSSLHFLDAVHGWAVQGGQLIRTVDGQSWETVGPFAPNNPLAAYQFTSVQDGFELGGYYSGSTIFATHNGGRSWKPVYQCATTLQVNGLTKNTSCFLRDLYFVSPQIGYAVGGGFNDPWAVIVKTIDGGATWKIIFSTTDVDTVSAVFFTDENNGMVRLHDKRVLITADGGQSWRGAVGAAEATLKFADPSVGWSCNLRGFPSCSYTLDGGKSWTARDIKFPEDIYGYSVPRRDRVYAVGDHGMIYRYRVVPSDYTAKGILDAPLMPAYGGALNTELERMRAHCKEIQTKLVSATGLYRDDYLPNRPQSAYGHLQTAALVSYEPEPQGFTQDTNSPAPTQGFTQNSGSPASLNVPASAVMQNCCAMQLQNLQTSVGSFSQQVPTFNSQFRNLNLLFVGLNMLTDLLNKAHGIEASFLALKQAPDTQSATVALQSLSGQVDGTGQTLVSGFQNLTLTDAAGGVFAGTVNNMAGSSMSSNAGDSTVGTTVGTTPAQGTNPNASATAQPQNQNTTTSNSVDNAAQKAKQKLKKVIPF